MKTHKNLYSNLCSYDNLLSAFQKARKGKSKKVYVINFERNLNNNLKVLQEDLIKKTYYPSNLKKFIIRDPKTRTIHSSIFRDRIVHHAIVNILSPIYEKIFIYDSFASRKNKGSHKAIKRFEYFIRKVSSNGQLVKNSFNNNSIKGYVLKADFRRYFDSINHKVLIKILRRKINDENLIWLVNRVLSNFEINMGIGMPLGNYTSQFFANVYLNELDYYIKNILKAKYYIRYVDDFVILHKNKKRLEYYLKHINNFIPCLKIELHPEKTEIHSLKNGITFLGYRIFYHCRLLRKRNIKYFKKRFERNKVLLKNNEITEEQFESRIHGWMGYSKFGNSFNLNKKLELDTFI
ncbi:MAG TPA: reverse transcriptase/maturase family protein [Candidatus Paceibacterota bacterium]|nr:reverse transcriptase/maturase family protein [Candidatus Paceibacterota bacterium]